MSSEDDLPLLQWKSRKVELCYDRPSSYWTIKDPYLDVGFQAQTLKMTIEGYLKEVARKYVKMRKDLENPFYSKPYKMRLRTEIQRIEEDFRIL